MPEYTIIDELIDYCYELYDLIIQDWEKAKIFFKKHVKYMFWVVVLVITMQFTDILSLGKSWDNYCSKSNTIQKGGSNAPMVAAEAPMKAAPAEATGTKGAAGNAGGNASGPPKGPGGNDAGKPPGGNDAGKPPGGNDAGGDKPPGEAGANDPSAPKPAGAPGGAGAPAGAPGAPKGKKPQFKLNLKKRFAQSIKNNPVFGNLDKIFGMVESMFYIVMVILIIVGIISLPVLVFIILTYTIIKHLLSKFAIL